MQCLSASDMFMQYMEIRCNQSMYLCYSNGNSNSIQNNAYFCACCAGIELPVLAFFEFVFLAYPVVFSAERQTGAWSTEGMVKVETSALCAIVGGGLKCPGSS